MIAFVLGLDATASAPARSPQRAGARGALRAAPRRRERKTADPRPRKWDLIENAFNQLLDATDPDGTTLFTWDDNGNQTEKAAPDGTTAYTWDARDRLSEIALPDGTTAAYGYDTENLRVSMDDVDGARRILLDGLEEWGEVDEATGELGARFDHDPTRIDALLAQDDAAGRAAMLTDALGSVYGLADDAAALRARYGYDVYGGRSASLEEVGSRWGFTGRAQDPMAMYSRARFFDPAAASFLASDPAMRTLLLDEGAPYSVGGAYSYVGNRPTLLTDPSGRVPVPLLRFATLLAGTALIIAGLFLLATAAEEVVSDGSDLGGLSDLGGFYFLTGLALIIAGGNLCGEAVVALDEWVASLLLRLAPSLALSATFSRKIVALVFLCTPRAVGQAMRFSYDPVVAIANFGFRFLTCSLRAAASFD